MKGVECSLEFACSRSSSKAHAGIEISGSQEKPVPEDVLANVCVGSTSHGSTEQCSKPMHGLHRHDEHPPHQHDFCRGRLIHAMHAPATPHKTAHTRLSRSSFRDQRCLEGYRVWCQRIRWSVRNVSVRTFQQVVAALRRHPGNIPDPDSYVQ
jgi:hypothetical protein